MTDSLINPASSSSQGKPMFKLEDPTPPICMVRSTCLLWSRHLFAFAGLLFFCATASGQILNPTESIVPPFPGVGHDYIQELNETVNPENGSVSLRLGVPVPPGRKLSMPFSFNYDSTGVMFFQTPAAGEGLAATFYSSPFAIGGWSYSLPHLENFYRTSVVPLPPGQSSDGSTNCGVTTNYAFTDTNGTYHQLNLSHMYNNVAGSYGGMDYQCQQAHYSEADVSLPNPIYQATLTNLTPPTESAPPNDGSLQVAGPDGTLYGFGIMDCGDVNACFRLPASIEDKDGNSITITSSVRSLGSHQTPSETQTNSFSVTDTLNRTLLSGPNFGLNGSTVTVSGLAVPYTLTWSTPSFSGYSVKAVYTGTDTSECGNLLTLPTGTQTQSFISSIQLPNKQSYYFTADPTYGTLQQVTYPTGGYIRYVYGINPQSTVTVTGGRGSFENQRL